MVGCAQGAFDITVPYLVQRKQFGQSLTEFQAVQHQIARAATDIEIARLLCYNAGRGVAMGQADEMQCSMAKLVSSEVAERVTSSCINLLGGVGFTRDIGVEKYYRDAKIGQIYEGTSNIQLQTIAKRILKDYKCE
jgi:short-chain 2-methylacyl-CoA dehydrogenase